MLALSVAAAGEAEAGGESLKEADAEEEAEGPALEL
jgi:hypothetical protein